MPRNSNRNDNASSSNVGAYIAAGVVGAVAAGIGYYFGKNSETSQTRYTNNVQNPTRQPTTNKNYTDTDPDCAICLNHMTPVRVLPCKHRFHDHCITRWVNQQPVCPKCNASTE